MVGGQKPKNPPGIIGNQSAGESRPHLEDDLSLLFVNNDSKLLCTSLCSLCSFVSMKWNVLHYTPVKMFNLTGRGEKWDRGQEGHQ